MSDEDLEKIPTLDDVLVAGDLDKAVMGDIDARDPEAIERFDALFNDDAIDFDDNAVIQESFEDSPADDTEAEYLEFASEKLFDSPDVSSPHDEQYDEPDSSEADNVTTDYASYEETATPETIHATGFADREIESTPSETIDEHYGTSDASDTGSYLEPSLRQETNQLASSKQSLIDPKLDDLDNADDTDEKNSDTSYHSEIRPETDASLHPITTPPELQIDVSQMLEKVMQEIMPEIETQIRSIVTTSLKKHLTKSDTDIDRDL